MRVVVSGGVLSQSLRGYMGLEWGGGMGRGTDPHSASHFAHRCLVPRPAPVVS